MIDREQIFFGKKKLCCCLEEILDPASKGIAIRVGIYTDKALAGMVKPISVDELNKLVEKFDKATALLHEIQKALD